MLFSGKSIHLTDEDRMTRMAGAMTRRRFAAATAMAFGALARTRPAQAAYPDRPIKNVVANTPGGPSDIIARIMAAGMQEAMGATVFVENRGGAGGNIGMGSVARADPDGYTILLSTSAYTVNPSLYHTLPYDPFKDFTAICELAVSPHVFAVKPELGVTSMKEFVALAKANPEKFNVSVPPIGTTPQLQAEVLKLRERLTQSGFEVTAMPGKEHMARIAREIPMFADIIVGAGIQKL